MRNLRSLLGYEIKRNPHIEKLYSDVDSMSEDMINSLSVKPWIRKALKLIKSDRASQVVRHQNAQQILANTRFFFADDPTGKMYEYTGVTQFVQLDRGELELRTGALFWMPDTGGILYETLFSKFIDRRISSRLICTITRTKYVEAYKDRLNANSPLNVPSLNQLSVGPLAGYGVRIAK